MDTVGGFVLILMQVTLNWLVISLSVRVSRTQAMWNGFSLNEKLNSVYYLNSRKASKLSV